MSPEDCGSKGSVSDSSEDMLPLSSGGGEPRCVPNPAKDTAGKYDVESKGGEGRGGVAMRTILELEDDWALEASVCFSI